MDALNKECQKNKLPVYLDTESVVILVGTNDLAIRLSNKENFQL